MEIFIVGDLYPNSKFKGLIDTAVLTISELGYDVAIFWKNIKPHEVSDFLNGSITYGLFEKDKVPFITLEFKHMNFDCPVNALTNNKEKHIAFQASEANVMRLYFVSAESSRIAAMRMIGLDMEFVNDLKEMVNKQIKAFNEPETVDRRIQAIWQKMNTKQMIKQAKRFRLPGSRGL